MGKSTHKQGQKLVNSTYKRRPRIYIWPSLEVPPPLDTSCHLPVFDLGIKDSTNTFKICKNTSWYVKTRPLTLFDMGFFGTISLGHNFAAVAPMIINFETGMELDVFYTMVTKEFVMSLLLRNSDVITCILADA